MHVTQEMMMCDSGFYPGIQCGTVYITRTLKKVEMEHDI